MKKKDFIGIAYVSLLIILWGTIGSLIDFIFLKSDVYIAGSIGQAITFSIIGFITTLLGIYLFPFFKEKINLI